MRRILGVLIFLIAVGAVLVSAVTKCKATDMPCDYSFKAEIAVAIPLAVSGIVISIFKSKEITAGAAIVGIFLGISMILIPYTLIGVCGSPMMKCTSLMKPSLFVFGILAIALHSGTVYVSLKK
jgi:hypothetical protein